jgi:MOSC domain-containing protein YiiM
MDAVINIPIAAVLAGRVKPFGPKGVPSGIEKTVVSGPVRITKLGFDIDEQGDPKHHGGPEKALHHYPRDHYPVWHDTLAAHGGNVDVLDGPVPSARTSARTV